MSRPVTWRSTTALFVGLAFALCLKGSASAQLANAPWPMLHHDARHTGQSQHNGPQTPTEQWTAPIGYPKSSPTIGADGTIYLGNRYTAYAINPANGMNAWTSFQHNLRRNAITIDVLGRLYFGTRDNRLNCLDSTNQGALVWDYRIANDGDVNTSPVIALHPTLAKYVLYAAGTWNGLVHGFDIDPMLDAGNSDARLLWPPVSTYNNSYSSPAVGPTGSIYTASGGDLYATKPDGTNEWVAHVGGLTRFTSPAVAADGTIYIGSSEGLTAVSPNGMIAWTFPVPGRVASTPAIATDGTIYIGSIGTAGSPGEFYALNPNGTQKWLFPPPADSRRNSYKATPAIGADGTIYTAGGNRVYALNPNGTLKWEHETASGRTIISSPAIGANGALYIGAGKGLLAIKDPAP